MSRLTATLLATASLTAAAHGQFPLGPGPLPPNPVVDPAINEYICRTVAEHAMSATLNPIQVTSVELVAARWQGELVWCFSRVYWTRTHNWHKKSGGAGAGQVAEVQYSLIQRRFYRRIYDIYLNNTSPIIYQYYDLGRVRTKINTELERFDMIAGDAIFPGPWPRGPSTMVPQISTSSLTTPPVQPGQPIGQPAKLIEEPSGKPIVIPPVVPTVVPPTINILPRPEPARTPPPPPSSTGAPPPKRGP